MANGNDGMNLRPFRRRVRILRASRCGAIGGCLGAVAALAMAGLDLAGAVYFEPWMLAVPVVFGVAAGILKALFERLPDAMVARSVDRRGGLEDRLTTAAEVPVEAGPMAGIQHEDAARHLEGLRPADLYPLRPGRWHGSMVFLALVTALVFVLGNSAILRTKERQKEADELRRTAAEVKRVVKPALEQAKRVDATADEKDLARRLNKFTRDLERARMSRPEALVKANQLAEQARRVEGQRSAKLAATAQEAQTAGAKLEKLAAGEKLEKGEEMRMAEQAAELERRIADAERRLGKGKDGKPGEAMSDAERKALEKQLAGMQKQLRELKLSMRAQKMLSDLANNPDYQEAQRILAELAKQAQQPSGQQAGQQKQLTKEQLEAMAKRLDELAARLDTDEKLAEYAKQLKEAAKNARLCKNGQCSGSLLGACGMGGFSMGARKGAGAPSRDTWVGDHGELPRDDKSSLLNVKFEDRVISSQRGDKGPETYVEVLGPSKPSGKSSVPYQKVLPKYEKSAESALKKSDIPPSERTRVREYFDSLRQ